MRMSDWSSDVCYSDLHLDRTCLFRGDGGDAVNTVFKAARVDFQQLVIAGGDDAAIIGKGSVNQLAGQDCAAKPEANFGCAEIDQNAAVYLIEQLAQLANAFAGRSEEHKSELQSLMRMSYAFFC